MSSVVWPRAVVSVALRGPGRALLLASVAGWITMAWLLTGDPQSHSAVAMGHGAHSVPSISHSTGLFTAMWMAMILAMAPPLLLREITRLWRTSLRRLRHLTIAWFLCGYAGIWLLAGIPLAMLFTSVSVGSGRLAVAVTLIAVWHCSPARQRCLNACHRVPSLRVFGIAAQWDSLRYGLWTGGYCAVTCGPVMLLVLLMEHNLVVMAAAAAVTTVERYLPARRPGWRFPILRRRTPVWPGIAAAARG